MYGMKSTVSIFREKCWRLLAIKWSTLTCWLTGTTGLNKNRKEYKLTGYHRKTALSTSGRANIPFIFRMPIKDAESFMISRRIKTTSLMKRIAMFDDQKVSVVIPCLNEARGLPLLLKKIPDYVTEVIVVYNGSTDDSAQVARSYSATVIHEDVKG